jgi:uncharacterized protein YciI
MAYFSVYALDRTDTQSLRTSLRPGHRQRLREHDHPVTVRIGGPLRSEAGEMIGTLLVVEAEVKQQVEAFWAGDPYVTAGLFVSVEITHFDWGLGLPEGSHG